MKADEAKRVMETTKKHCEPVAELAIELITMIDEEFGTERLKYEKELEEMNNRIDTIQASLDRAVEFAANVDVTVELEAALEENEKLKKEIEELKKQAKDKPRRGRPPKKKIESNDPVRSLAEELASMSSEN